MNKLALAGCVTLALAPVQAVATELPAERTIGPIEPVFEFHAAMPTGVTVAASGRIFINFSRWGDDVPFTVGENPRR